MPVPGDLIRRRLTDLGHSQEWLADELGTSQSTISDWIVGKRTPSRAQAIDLEAALKVRDGRLARLFGYLPANTKPIPVTVEGAINADPNLPDAAKRALLAAYRELLKL